MYSLRSHTRVQICGFLWLHGGATGATLWLTVYLRCLANGLCVCPMWRENGIKLQGVYKSLRARTRDQFELQSHKQANIIDDPYPQCGFYRLSSWLNIQLLPGYTFAHLKSENPYMIFVADHSRRVLTIEYITLSLSLTIFHSLKSLLMADSTRSDCWRRTQTHLHVENPFHIK